MMILEINVCTPLIMVIVYGSMKMLIISNIYLHQFLGCRRVGGYTGCHGDVCWPIRTHRAYPSFIWSIYTSGWGIYSRSTRCQSG